MKMFRVRVGVPGDRCEDAAVLAKLATAAGVESSGNQGQPNFGTVDYFYEYDTQEEARAAEQRIGDTGHICFSTVETRKKS